MRLIGMTAGGHRSGGRPTYVAERPPPDSATRVLYVGGVDLQRELPARFTTVVPVARLDDPSGFQGVNYGIRVSLCANPIHSWSQIWPELMTLRIDHGA